jgi:hypothetical protein
MIYIKNIIYFTRNILFSFFTKFLFSLNLFYWKDFAKNYNKNLYNCKIYILTHGNKDRLKYLNFFVKNLNIIFINKNDEKFWFLFKKKIPLKKKKLSNLIYKKFMNFFLKKTLHSNINIKNNFFEFSELNLNNFKLSQSNISLNLKHHAAWKYAQNLSEKYAIVLEDDVIFKLNSFKTLHHLLLTLPKNFDYICLAGGSYIKHSKILKRIFNKNLFKINTQSTRTTCGYIISKKFLKKIFSNKSSFSLPIDFELNILLSNKKASVYWTEPTIVTHGSANNWYNTINYQNSK